MTVIATVVSRYRNGKVDYRPGQTLHLTDEQAAQLFRDSPGSFRVRPASPANPDPVPEPAPRESAMSSETATGLVVPDRKARRGRKRSE